MLEAWADACLCLRRPPFLVLTAYGRIGRYPNAQSCASAAAVAALDIALQRRQNEAIAFIRRLPSVVT